MSYFGDSYFGDSALNSATVHYRRNDVTGIKCTVTEIAGEDLG